MKNANTAEISLPQSIIILGPPGTGKTTLATQFPKAYILNADNNIEGPIRWLREHNKPVTFFYDDVLHATLDELTDAGFNKLDLGDFPPTSISAVPRRLRYRYMAYLLNQAVKNPDIETIILDSLTSLVEVFLDEVRRQEPKLEFGDPFGAKTLDSTFRIQDWGAFGALMKNFLFQLLGSGKRIIVIGHINVQSDELTNILQEFIAVPGKLALTLGAWFQEVWIISLEDKLVAGKITKQRMLKTKPSNAQGKLGLKSSILPDEQVIDLDTIMSTLTSQHEI